MSMSPDRMDQAIRPVAEPVIDLAHLDQYTLGDRALQTELLQLFRAQLKDQSDVLKRCDSQSDWATACQTLKGAARAIGAVQICQMAEALEITPYISSEDRETVLRPLMSAAAVFEAEVERYL